jgi:integration host factor subunit alpha
VSKKNFKKIDLINYISINTGLSHNFSKKLLSDILVILNTSISSGYLNLKNLGTFKVFKKKQRIGRNPKTKEKFLISARKSIKFTPAKNLSEYMSKIYE